MQPLDQEGRTVEEALQTALATLNKTVDEVEYEVLEEGNKGILGVGSKPALIRVWVKEPKEIRETKALLNEIFKELDITFTSEIKIEENTIKVSLESEDSGILIGRQGQTLEALQYLVNQILHFENYRVVIDIANYRERQMEKLTNMVKQMAQKVKTTRRRITLKPMTPAERKAVHETIKDIKDVTTLSIGTEPNRRVVITPIHEKRYNRQNRRGVGNRNQRGNRTRGYSNQRRSNYGTKYNTYRSKYPNKELSEQDKLQVNNGLENEKQTLENINTEENKQTNSEQI